MTFRSTFAAAIVHRRLITARFIGFAVLAFTAVPTRLQPVTQDMLRSALAPQWDWVDGTANILGYIPLGVALAQRGIGRALLTAASLSSVAEVSQLFSFGRIASVADIAANVLGAAVGVLIGRVWRDWPADIPVSLPIVGLAAIFAVAYPALGHDFTLEQFESRISASLGLSPRLGANERGVRSPGTLEASWTFADIRRGIVTDTSGHGLVGLPVNEPALATGPFGTAGRFAGNQWVDFGDPVELRLRGSMTITAWIHPVLYPSDDAVIVSSLNLREWGYQLDASVDQGARTIAFKLSDSSGRPMARYGRTELAANKWYHVAGVYDARARTLDVYVDGRRDNGCLAGIVGPSQHVSDRHVLVAARPALPGFEFRGLIDDVRIYSRALSDRELLEEVERSERGQRLISPRTRAEGLGTVEADSNASCPNQGAANPRVAGPHIVFGMAVALLGVGLWPGRHFRMVSLAFVGLSGALLLLLPWNGSAPLPYWETVGLVLLGGLGVAASVKEPLRRDDSTGATRRARRVAG